MSKLLKLKAISLSLISSCAFAQPMFEEPATAGAKPTTSMSPSEFKSAVNNMSQQTNNNLNQQAKQLFPQNPTGNKNAAGAPNAQQPAAPNVDNSFSVNNGPATGTPAATGAAPTPASPATPTPSDGYTGFGSGDKNKPSKPSTPASSGSSGGWNINY